jgi:guanine deaminase
MNTMSPDYYRDESVEEAVSRSRECIDYVRQIDPSHELITPIITPRFAPSCTAECLTHLGKLHRESGYPAQTHISENAGEIELVREKFPESASYAHVYDDAGLLTDKMILAHAIHLSDAERKLIRQRGSKISHCPASNTALTSGCAKVRELLNQGIDVGLGTDVSGGFSPSILEMARQAIWVSRHVAMADGDEAKLSTEEVLWLATRGGAKVVGLEERIGGFEVGKDWDAQMISMGEVDVLAEQHDEHEGPVDIFGWESWEERVHKWVYGGDDRNTVAVWVGGRLVHSTSRYRP